MLSLVTLPWYIPVRKGALTTKLVALRDTRKIDLEELLKVHQIRRGRVKFIKEGDFNSKYFSQGGNQEKKKEVYQVFGIWRKGVGIVGQQAWYIK